MPGGLTSMPYSGAPTTIFGASTSRVGLPMILKVFGSFSVTVLKSGAGNSAALDASSP